MSDWHIDQSGKRIGPISQELLLQMVTAGHVNPGDLVWTDGMPTWQRADTQSWFPGAQQPVVISPGAPPTLPNTPPDNAPAVTFTNTPSSIGTVPPPPPNLMVFSIIEIFCCCLIAGIIGIVYDSKAKTEYAKGNYAAAQEAYNTGKIWLIVGVIVGAIGTVLYIALVTIGALNTH